MAGTSSFSTISLCGQGSTAGRLDLSADAATWTSTERDTNKKVQVDLRKAASARWVDLGRACQLWLTDSEGALTRFDGLRTADFERVQEALGSALAGPGAGAGSSSADAGKKLIKTKLSAAGHNWGTFKVEGNTLEFREAGEAEGTAGALITPIPLPAISQASMPGKHEVDVQFFDADDVAATDEVLVEMRLYVPPGHLLPDAASAAAAARRKAEAKALGSKGGSKAGEEDEDGAAEERRAAIEAAGADPAAQLHALVTDAAGVAGVTGDIVAELPEDVGQFMVPRGKFGVEFYPAFVRLIGKTHEFKVAYKTIGRMFYLPAPATGAGGIDESRHHFVISLEDPLRHGQQRLSYLIMRLDRRPISVPLTVSDEDVRAGRFEGLGKDSAVLEGDLPRTVASLFKQLTGKPVFKPGGFVSAGESKCIRCSCKSNEGLLYPLEKSLLFIHKPARWLKYSDVEAAEFRRSASAVGSAAAGRPFDLALRCRPGVLASAEASAGGTSELLYQSLDGSEHHGLRAYLAQRGVKVEDAALGGGKPPPGTFVELEGSGGSEASAASSDAGDDDDDDDSDASGGGKAKGKAAAGKGKGGAGAGSSGSGVGAKRGRPARAAAVAAGAASKSAAAAAAASDDDDDSEDDASYHGEKGADESSDGEASAAGSEDSDGSGSGSDGGSDDDDDGFRKKKKKPAAKTAKAKPKGKVAADGKAKPKGKVAPKKKPAKKKRRDEDDESEDDGSGSDD